MGRSVVYVGDRNICTGPVWKPESGKLTGGSRLVLMINMKRDLELIVCEDTGRIYMTHRSFL